MVRRIILAVPILLLLVVFVSFLSTSSLSRKKENAMFIGSLGEASNLNPILSTDASSSQISALIFQSLLGVDENMNPVGELAESWKLSQISTLFFPSAEEAASARASVESLLAGQGRVEIDGTDGLWALRIFLTEPGVEFTQKLVEGVQGVRPLSVVNFSIAKGAPSEVLKRVRESAAGALLVRDFSESAQSLELTFAMASQELLPLLEEVLKGGMGDLEVLWEVEEERNFLAEPEVHFVLRDGVLWQDGGRFSARDVEFTYRAIMDDAVASPRKPDFTLIREVEVLGDLELVVRYRRPYAPALNSWRMSILPAHILEGREPGWWAENFNRKPVGTGPFRLAQWKTNEFVRLEKNPLYWQAPGPWLDAVVFRVFPDPLTLRLAFETAQVDFWSVDPWAVTTFRDDPRFQVFSAPSSSYSYVGWNLRRPLFQDPVVRRALAHAVNVPQMIQYLLYGFGIQSTGIFTPQMWFFDPEVEPFAYDPALAVEMLESAGWRRGRDGILEKDGMRFSFTLITNNANEVRRDVATLIQDDLREVGIEVKIELYEWAVFISRFVNKAEFDAVVLGWSLPQDDFDQFQIWHSSQAQPERLNVVGYNNPEVDRLLEAIRQEFNRERVIEMASRIQNKIFQDQPYLFLFVPESTSVMWKDSYRVCRPDGEGGWIVEPVRMTKAGWSHYLDWFFRPGFEYLLPEGVSGNMQTSEGVRQ